MGTLLLAEQLGLGALAPGDIAHNRNNCGLALPGGDRSRDFNRHLRSALFQKSRFVLIRYIVALQPALVTLIDLGVFIRTEEFSDITARQVGHLVTNDLAEAMIRKHNPALDVHQYAVIGIARDRAQVLFAFAQRLLGALAIRDVECRSQHRRFTVVVDCASSEVHPALLTALGADAEFVVAGHALPAQTRPAVGAHALPIVRVNNSFPSRQDQKLVTGVPGDRTERRIDVQQSFPPDKNCAIGGLRQGAELLFAFA